MIAKVVLGFGFLVGALAAAVFVPAGTVDYWQAWVVLAVFATCSLAITIFLAVRDPALLARRVAGGPLAEQRGVQRIVQGVASLAFIATFVVSALDHRAGWSRVPTAIVVGGDVMIALGFAIVLLVFRANTFASAVVVVDRDQALVSTGPYGVVRHPMYAGALVMLVGIPIGLASWWGLVALPPLVGALVSRLLDEETLLVAQLAGYAEYRGRVRYRLVPGVW